MANEDNIIGKGFDARSTEEAREFGAKGGKASGEARRRKKTMKEWAQYIGSLGIDVKKPSGDTEHMDFDGAVMYKQYQAAIMEGDTKAAKFIAELKGEMVERKEVELKNPEIVVKSEEQKAVLENIIQSGK